MSDNSRAADSEIVVQNTSRPLAEVGVTDALIWAVVDAAPDGLVVVNTDGVIELVNCRTEELFGYERSDLLGRKIEALVPESRRGVHRAHRNRYRAEPTVRAMGEGSVLQGLRADGSVFPIEVSLSPVTVGDSNWIVAAIRDVTERVEADRRNTDIRQAFDTAQDGLLIFDPVGSRFTYVNKSVCEMHGYTREEMLNMGPMHLSAELTPSRVDADLGPLLSGRADSVTIRINGLRRDGTEFPVEVLINRPDSGDPEHPQSLVAVVRDMTDRVEVEQALAESRSQAELMSERERFARDLHDTVIGDLFGVGMGLQASLTPTIKPDEAQRRVRGAIDTVDQVITKIRRTIFGLTGPVSADDSADNSLAAQLRKVADHAFDRLGYRPVVVVNGRTEDLPAEVVAQLIPTVEETLNNVAKHAKASSVRILVTVLDEVVLEVSDNGVGLDTGAGGHRGLGLENIRRRAELLGGRCTVEQAKPTGLTVSWSVPLG